MTKERRKKKNQVFEEKENKAEFYERIIEEKRINSGLDEFITLC